MRRSTLSSSITSTGSERCAHAWAQPSRPICWPMARAGLPMARSSTQASCTAPMVSFPMTLPTPIADRALRAGWVAGGGIEARLAGNITGKIEYLHMDFGFDRGQAILPLNATPIAVNFNSRITEDLVRLGINYKFDPIVGFYTTTPTAASISQWRERPRMVYKAPVTALWTWTGFYFGANAGYTVGKFDSRHARERRFARNSTVCDQLLFHAQGRDRRRPSRLQLASRHLARWARSGCSILDASASSVRSAMARSAIPASPGFDAPVTLAHTSQP